MVNRRLKCHKAGNLQSYKREFRRCPKCV